MKRSDYITQRTAHWVALWGRKESNPLIAQLVTNDVEAVEASGKVWDEEEPSSDLPQQIRFATDGSAEKANKAIAWLPPSGLIVAETVDGALYNQFRMDTLRAMVDAYNDWGTPHGTKRQQLLALLQDQPGFTAERIRQLLGVVQSD